MTKTLDGPSPCSERLAYSVIEASKLTSLGRTTIYQLISKGALTPIKIGGRTLIPAKQLRDLLLEEHA